MKATLSLLCLVAFLFSCKKDDDEQAPQQDRILNGVNVNVATSTFNSFRTQGIQGHPAVQAVTWNDTLSHAAYNYAKAKTEDSIATSSIYYLSNGQFILDFPGLLNYSRLASFALYYGFPANTNVSIVINAGFASTDQATLSGLMDSTFRQFGMGQYGDKWFVMLSE